MGALIRRDGWRDLLSRARAGSDLRVELPDDMGTLVVLFIEGSQDVAAWREWPSDLDMIELLGLDSARSLMELLPSHLEVVWQRHYEGEQKREQEFLDALEQVSRFVSQPFAVPDWLQEP